MPCGKMAWVTQKGNRIIIAPIGARISVVVKALCYKPKGRRFDSRRDDFLNLPNPSNRTRPWGLLSP
jgi:hypothetical protein